MKTITPRNITLSVGDVVQVRPLDLGTVQKIAPHLAGLLVPGVQSAEISAAMKCQRIVAVDCARSEVFPLTDKPVAECTTSEISADVLTVEDLAAITLAALELSSQN